MYDPDRYGEMLQAHWSDRIASYVPTLSLLPKQRVAELHIEELDGELTCGVKTKALKDIGIYRESDYIAIFECKGRAWDIFRLHGVLLLSDAVGNNCQTIKVAITGKTPYIQLMCIAKTKYQDCVYRKGQVLTLFVGKTGMPSPPMLCVQPRVEQTYVPMLPRQRLQIITDITQSLEWRLGEDSSLLYIGKENVGTNVCEYFECLKHPESQETLFINSGNNFKTICIPVLSSSERRYPVIIDPVKTCVIYAHNIDGFIVRSYRHVPLLIQVDCPLQVMYTKEGKDFSETKVRITKIQEHFVLERVNDQWLAKSGGTR